MIDVDSKISKYLETKRVTISLRKEVEQLQILMRNLEDLIKEENKQVKDLENEVIASIKVENLLDKISKLLNIDKNKIDVIITVISGTYAKTLEELYGYERKDAKDLKSYLSIKLKDGTNICTKDLRLFNSLNEIQADGYILLRHCKLEATIFQRYNLIVNKNINDIICNFRIDALDINNYEGQELVLPNAIRECINDENIERKKLNKKVQFVKN